MGLSGAALANTVTYALSFTMIHSYCSFNDEIKEAWFWPKRESFEDLIEFF
jgi:Na+-driven multidrug efflux pump